MFKPIVSLFSFILWLIEKRHWIISLSIVAVVVIMPQESRRVIPPVIIKLLYKFIDDYI
ncbi:hypothetical protein [Dendrosporobacter sp. 1207_IL3150]|uniref:hypothetical protein n=1 Tax=Dendrosporobacter sp. 1207_IL3150 TaxID=3084054 RepID=UPI002FDAC078